MDPVTVVEDPNTRLARVSVGFPPSDGKGMKASSWIFRGGPTLASQAPVCHTRVSRERERSRTVRLHLSLDLQCQVGPAGSEARTPDEG